MQYRTPIKNYHSWWQLRGDFCVCICFGFVFLCCDALRLNNKKAQRTEASHYSIPNPSNRATQPSTVKAQRGTSWTLHWEMGTSNVISHRKKKYTKLCQIYFVEMAEVGQCSLTVALELVYTEGGLVASLLGAAPGWPQGGVRWFPVV